MKKKAMGNEVENMTFEEAFSELERVVKRLENGQLALEESLALYERGQTLACLCGEMLDEAELKIEQITPQGDQPLNAGD